MNDNKKITMNNLLVKENFDSENLWKKFQLLSKTEIRTLSKGLEWTVINMPNALLIGGTATVNYISGDRELTPDLDFMVTAIELVKTKLNQIDIKYQDLYGNTGSLGIVVPDINVDFLDSNVGNIMLNKLIMDNPNVVTIGGYQVKVVNPELLAILKFELGRDRDLNDALLLLSSGACDKNEYISYVNQLKGTLQDYDSICNYQELIK